MNISVLKKYYAENGFSEYETEIAASALFSFNEYISRRKSAIELCSVNEMKRYLSLLIQKRENTQKNLLALARSAYLAENNEVYIYFTSIIERETIIKNIRENTEKTIGKGRTDAIFDSIIPPVSGAPPETAYSFTRELVETMERTLPTDECRDALTANAHGIPKEAFQKEKDFFNESTNLQTYLEDSHKRIIKTLQEHADSGKVWFEQKITQTVVDYVKSHKEVLGGVLKEGKIYWTKIPYDTEAWLAEKDPRMKRYFACHCPMAREVLADAEERIPRAWCNCTSGFVKQRFNAIFEEDVQVDLLETVLDNQDRCRFAIHVPPQYL